ncbi:uncharacterized protein LOC135341019 isoform X2 [Halichondria panicea]|uniref:uncharacterized protein LOC135341019 isoform X2 n=1 Tax=Halichondria panicea TaxID=6063 RepID=UPI00312B6E15
MHSLAQQLVLYCPGPATISCSTVTPIIWDGTAFNGQCPHNGISFQTINNDSIGESSSCGELNVTITNIVTTIDVGSTVVNVDSSLSFSAQPSLSGLTVVCRSGANAAVNSMLLIPDPTQAVSVSQDSLTAVTVNLTGGDSCCISLYFVVITEIGSSDSPTIISSFSPSISVTGLDLCRNRYFIVGFVQAPSGVQGGRSTPQMISLEAVTNVKASTTTLSWTQLANTASDGCNSGYIISWTEGEDTTVGSSTSVLVSNLHNFPFCQSQTLTVTPNTPSGRLTVGTSLQNVIFEHPDFAAPVVSVFFTLQSDNVVININWQDISLEAVPLRLFGFSKIGEGVCNPQFSATGSSMTQLVPGAQSGDRYTVCVVFINNKCMNRTDDTVRVPVQLLVNPQLSVGDSSVSIVVSVSPSPPMSLDSLSILATIDPPHASAVLANYPTSSQQYTVMFDGLTPGTLYIYDIRVILRNDSTITIGLPVTGSFTVPACGTVCVTVVVVVSAVLLVVAVLSLAGGFVAYKYKNRSKDWSVRSFKSENAEKHELTLSLPPPPPDSLYADPKFIEHQAAPGTEDQYAIVDKNGKKNTKPNPTPSEAVYQDPCTIEHETAASGVMCAVVDKPKRSSKKKGGSDVVPPASEGSTCKRVEEATKPNSSQLPQELYSEVFNALPKGMAPKVVRNGTKN